MSVRFRHPLPLLRNKGDTMNPEEVLKELRERAQYYTNIEFVNMAALLNKAADTIEKLMNIKS